jgi:hypothetical protein
MPAADERAMASTGRGRKPGTFKRSLPLRSRRRSRVRLCAVLLPVVEACYALSRTGIVSALTAAQHVAPLSGWFVGRVPAGVPAEGLSKRAAKWSRPGYLRKLGVSSTDYI